MFGHSYSGHSDWCDDNDGYELMNDALRDDYIEEEDDEFYDIELDDDDEEGMVQDSDTDDWDDDDSYDLEDDVHE
jgi:hypothetical protein|tara:strand:+ start:1000 stop:1224 length:225 start_codon:yes stop_codon:yes gene_type:complete